MLLHIQVDIYLGPDAVFFTLKKNLFFVGFLVRMSMFSESGINPSYTELTVLSHT